jgi:hypothetical protein
MSLLGRSLLISAITLGLSAPAFAQPKADAGSGPTKGAVSTDDAGSGPTKGVKPNADTTAAETKDSTANRGDVTPGPKSTGGSQPVTPITPEKKQ